MICKSKLRYFRRVAQEMPDGQPQDCSVRSGWSVQSRGSNDCECIEIKVVKSICPLLIDCVQDARYRSRGRDTDLKLGPCKW